MKKRYVYLVSTIIITILIIVMYNVLQYGKYSKIKEGTFEWIPSMEYNSIKGTYFYTDEYFTKTKGKEKNSHLRTMAMNLVLAATPSIDKSTDTENITNLLTEIGFNNISTYDYEEIKSDTIGTVISHKKIKDYEVIIVALRGEKYDIEWETNFLLSEEGNVKGFDDASKKVLKRIKEYIDNNIKRKTKILVTGYSRSGAVANLVGVYLNENLKEYNLKSDNDIYVYTFEAPNSSTSIKRYNNIHNIVNQNDIVTYLYPKEWNLQNNGVIEYIAEDKKYIPVYSLKAELNINNFLSIEKNRDKNNKIYRVEIEKFLNDLTKWLVTTKSDLNNEYSDNKKSTKYLDNGIDRKLFVNTFEKYIPKLIDIMSRKTSTEIERINNFISNDFYNELKDNNKLLLIKMIVLFNRENIKDSDIKDISEKIVKSFKNAKRNNKIAALSEKECNFFEQLLGDKNNYLLMHKVLYSSFNENPKLFHISTLISNFDTLTRQHYSRLNYELVKSKDSFYK